MREKSHFSLSGSKDTYMYMYMYMYKNSLRRLDVDQQRTNNNILLSKC